MRGASRPLTADSAGATYRFDAYFIYLTIILSIYRIFIQVAFLQLNNVKPARDGRHPINKGVAEFSGLLCFREGL